MRNSVGRNRKILIAILSALAFTLIGSAVLCGIFGSGSEAFAAGGETQAFRCRVGRRLADYSFACLPPDVTLTEDSGGGVDVVLLSSPDNNNATVSYCVTNGILAPEELKSPTLSWLDFRGAPVNLDGIEYKSENVTLQTGRWHIYFRLSDGGKIDFYEPNYSVKVIKSLDIVEITDISAVYRDGNTDKEYDAESGWIGTELKFVVATAYAAANEGTFDPDVESLYYSVDGEEPEIETADGTFERNEKKEWIPMNGNKVGLREDLKNCSVWFKDGDKKGNKPPCYKKFDIPVNIDVTEPEFGIEANTEDLNGDEIKYANGAWSAADVRFVLTPKVDNVSAVEYSVSLDGGMTYTPFDGMGYRLSDSREEVRFRAKNGAGIVWNNRLCYRVNIDGELPAVSIKGETPNPDSIEGGTPFRDLNPPFVLEDGAAVYGVPTAAVANGKITLKVYNRTPGDDRPVSSKSKTTFYFGVKTSGAEPIFRKMTDRITDDGDEYYRIEDEVDEYTGYAHREYWFYIENEAGLRSKTAVYKATLIWPDYEIKVDDIEVNTATGWANEPIRVYVEAPSDAEEVKMPDGTIEYTVPTAKYDFYYVPTKIEMEPYKADNVEYVPDSRLPAGVLQRQKIRNGRRSSIYGFYIDASANSDFRIFAVNEAGKRSKKNKDFITPVIKIDTKKPSFTLTAEIGDPGGDAPGGLEYYKIVSITSINGLQAWAPGTDYYTMKAGTYFPVDTGVVKVPVRGALYYKGPRVEPCDRNEFSYFKDLSGKYFPADKILSGQWVNGTIKVELKVKDGVSGVYVKELEKKGDVWAESADRLEQTESLNEGGDKYLVFKREIAVGLDSSGCPAIRMSKELRFRVYTESGVFDDVSFIADIDNGEINLGSVEAVGGNRNGTVYGKPEGGFSSTIRTDAVCEDFGLKILSEEQADHCTVYLKDPSGEFGPLDDNIIPVEIPNGQSGVIEKTFFIESDARNYWGKREKTREYTLEIPYNTLNITIIYAYDEGCIPSPGEWREGEVAVDIALKKNTEGGKKELNREEREKYVYYYGLLPFEASPSAAVEYRPLAGGYGENGYRAVIKFDDESFYGYIKFLVKNEAGFPSDEIPADASLPLFRIDNTTPVISAGDDIKSPDQIIRIGAGTMKADEEICYYSKEPIILKPPVYRNKAPIKYYYFPIIAGPIPSANPDEGSGGVTLNGWTPLPEEGISLDVSAEEKHAEFCYVFYARNSLGKAVGGVGEGAATVYRFIIDVNEMDGTLTYDMSAGGFDQGMVEFLWTTEARLSLEINGDGLDEVKFMYSCEVDESGNPIWEPYKESVSSGETYYSTGEKHELIFREANFPDGVDGVFSFKAVNRAGTEKVFGQRIRIALDTVTPDFEIATTVRGESFDASDINVGSALNWKDVPITVEIKMLKKNKSGVRITYELKYKDSTGAEQTTRPREIPDFVFTTDRLDGFNKNNDAVLTVTATSKADGSKSASHKVRLKVDQTEPRFTLKGIAKDEGNDNVTEQLSSGDWTRFGTVYISKAAQSANVSKVTYTYDYETISGNKGTNVPWDVNDPLFKESANIKVRAESAAGRVYVEEFIINIDAIPPRIMIKPSIVEGEEFYIDVLVTVEETNLEICEYITTAGETRGFSFDPAGYIISTSSVDNGEKLGRFTEKDENGESVDVYREYRGYVKLYVRDLAGNEATFEFYMLPFKLDVNNITLSENDSSMVRTYENDLNRAREYITKERENYFDNTISRLKDRINTLENEIKSYRDYLEGLSRRTSFELKSDYEEMFSYKETYNNYALKGQQWIQDAIKGDSGSVYYGYFEKFERDFTALRAQMDRVRAIEEKTMTLPAVNVVAASDYNEVLRVYDEYGDLAADQKACFKTNLHNKLFALKKRCEILMLTDAETGIALDANFAPGARVKVERFDEKTEYYQNAQQALLSSVASDEARAIASVCKVSLAGAAAQTGTGNIKVKMEIPEDFRQYIVFGVYRMTSNGTIIKVENVKREGDGKSVVFNSGELTTFILTAKANVESRETAEDAYGTFLGLDLDVKMIKTMAIIGGALLLILVVIIVIAGVRHKTFLDSYNRAYRSGIYRKGVQRIPKGNTVPRENPLHKGKRVKEQKKPY